MEGWIKIWRKVKDSELFLQDPTAWRVFEYLLMSVDYKTGKYTSGRNRDALYLCMKPSTFYKALKRLEKKWLSINITSNNKYSTISIINWGKYQGNGNSSGNNKVTTKEQQSNTNKEVKNKELKNNTTIQNELLKFLKTQPKILNPEGYLKWLINEYGQEHLGRLLKIEFSEWKTNLEYWKGKK